MEKKKERKQKASIPENETPTQKFQRIATHRCQVLGKTYNLITRLPKQPAYYVSQEDAIKLVEWVNTFHDAFIQIYDPIARGEKISKSGEREISKIF